MAKQKSQTRFNTDIFIGLNLSKLGHYSKSVYISSFPSLLWFNSRRSILVNFRQNWKTGPKLHLIVYVMNENGNHVQEYPWLIDTNLINVN